MYGHINSNAALRSLQFAVTGLLGLAVVFLLSVLVATVTEASVSKQTQAANSTPNISYDDPNIVSVGLGSAADSALRDVNSMAHTVQSGMLSAATAAIHGVAGFGHGLQRSVASASGAAANGIAWTVRAPAKAVGIVGDAPGVKAIIQPDSNSTAQIPTIDPDAAIFHTSQPADKLPAVAAPPVSPVVVWPISGTITTYFGVPHWPYQPTHSGLDISSGRAKGVTAVHPFRAGTVVAVVPVGVNGLGNHVVVDHGGGLSSVYAHLNSIAVQVGQQIDTSMVLGQEGTTGASTGPHLHLEIRQNGVPQNPLDYIGR